MFEFRISRVFLTPIAAGVLLLAIAGGALAQTDNVVFVPDPLEISLADVGYEDDVVVRYTGGGSGLVYGFSIDVTWDSAVVTATPGDFSKPASGPFEDTTWFIVTAITGGVRIDAALPGGSAGTTADDLFQATFTATSVQDYVTSDLTLTLNYFRDSDNNPLSGFDPEHGQAIVDLVAPSVTGVAIANTTLAHTNDYVKDSDDVTVTATVTDADPGLAAANIVADLSGFSGGAAVVAQSFTDDVATWTVSSATCSPSDGTLTVAVTATDDLGNAAGANDTIIADNTAPTAMSGLTAGPGHKKVDLAWTDALANDMYYAGVVIRYTHWSDYPNYVTAPNYPAGETAGDGEAFNGTGTAHTQTFDPDLRGIYYYSGFVYDIARNYSAASGAGQDRATNYWLGDVSDDTYGFYDGLVDVADFTALASSFGLSSGAGGFKDECDVGPTDDLNRLGIPTPDDEIQFEDLMIFAMNAGLVGPRMMPPTGTLEPMFAWESAGEGVWSLMLVEPCRNLKGLNVLADLPSGAATVAGGALLARQPAPVFLRNIAPRGLEAGLAIMGTGLGIVGSGELMTVTLAGDAELPPTRIMARGIENEKFEVEPEAPTDLPTPTVFSLAQNSPNPFNPSTKISFSLPAAEMVRLSIYALDGRLVRTLLAEQRAAGSHHVNWDGSDELGRQVASGTYVYRITAGQNVQTRKMSLMK